MAHKTCGSALYVERSTLPDKFWFCNKKPGHKGKHRSGLKRWITLQQMHPADRENLIKMWTR